ncbi:MAG: hypothetical protein LBQ52_08265 [Helicobacteraceae bacterium]|jgi:hypothetical protein|nr:hypothetical protein [Helicobacteraceae bacterium]
MRSSLKLNALLAFENDRNVVDIQNVAVTPRNQVSPTLAPPPPPLY